jgi:hypothetical protein
MTRRQARLLLCPAVVVAAAAAFASSSPAPAADSPVAYKDRLRELWTRNDEHHLRGQWLVLGSVPPSGQGPDLRTDHLAAEGGEASIRPKADDTYALADGSVLKWRPVTAFHDPVDVAQGLSGSARIGVSYAFRTFTRASAGQAQIALGSDESVRVWVNGRFVHEHLGPRALVPDEDRIVVDLRAGENVLLVKAAQTAGPWTFCVRVLETGARLRPRAEIGPAILAEEGGILAVRTDVPAASREEAPVTVQAVGAGGAVVGTVTAPRGETVRLDSRSWREGAYEIRCTTRTFLGREWSIHLPWYKGDSLSAARELVAAGRAAAGARGDELLLPMLADMVLDRLGGDLDAVRGDPWWLVHSPLMELEELRLARAGKGSPVRPYGFVRLAYRDEIDGSVQFCRAYLPPHYDARRKWPVVIQLHGYHPENPPYVRWYFADFRHAPLNTDYADNHDVIVLEPHGRGNTAYQGLGEADVLLALRMATERFSVDEDRVYLMGESMGGEGVWRIGARHPELFAAIAPTFGGFDIGIVVPEQELSKMSPAELAFLEGYASFNQIDSLLNLPVFVHQGDADRSVPVENSRKIVRTLQRWGYDVRYREHPGGAHENLLIADEIVDWFLRHERNPMPAHVRVRAVDLASASAYWAQVELCDDFLSPIELDAEVIGQNAVRLDTRNASRVTLTPAAPLVDPARAVTVTWNGVERTVRFTRGRLTLEDGAVPAGLLKTPRLAGGIRDVFNTPFAIVVGTVAGDPKMREACRGRGLAAAAFWKSYQNQEPRVFDDVELGDEQAKAYSLILIGGPEENAVTRRLAARLPVAASAGEIRIGPRTFRATDAGIQYVYPSPLDPDRYVSVVAGTSPEGLSLWDSGEAGQNRWDYVVFDAKSSSEGILPERLRIASGFFDAGWEFSERFVREGDAEERAKAPVRKPR